MIAFIQGFGIGGGLIVAIGAQNSFVLAQGVRRQYVFLIPLICASCDIILICAGSAGVGTYIASRPEISYYAAVGGAFFLFWYGARSLRSAFVPTAQEADRNMKAGLRSIIFTTLALTLLNPHVYLDTIVLLGSISGQFQGTARILFTLGACLASVLWFFSLSYGSGFLEPLFRKPISWKVLDLLICMVMWTIAVSIWPVT